MARPDLVNTADKLVVRARTDGEALGLLYAQYYDKIFRYCLHRLFVREVAEDVTSAVFLQVAEHIVTFKGDTDSTFRSWLYAIASNHANSHIRKAARRRQLLELVARRRHEPVCSQDGPALGQDLDWPTVFEAITELKPMQQSIVTLRFFEEMPFDRIAEILNLKPVTVRVACSRALAVLRKKLSKLFDLVESEATHASRQ
ncbi:MAG: RNA polymerase sigma factor [Planctomycetes bacterium]|nr:RNA polymerase sigma factor [Planctomycetota bacterium]